MSTRRVAFQTLAVLSILACSHADLTVVVSGGQYTSRSTATPSFKNSMQNFAPLNNVSFQILNQPTCGTPIPAPVPQPFPGTTNVTTGAVLLVVNPLCYPDDLWTSVHAQGYSALLVGYGVHPGPGLFALNFWRSTSTIPFPILDVKLNFGTNAYKNINVVSIVYNSYNDFETYAGSAAYIVLVVFGYLVTAAQTLICIHRLVFNIRQRMAFSISGMVAGLHLLSGIFRLALLADPMGVRHQFSYGATQWLVFFSTALGEVGTFVIAFSFHKIIAQLAMDFQGFDIQGELVCMIGFIIFSVLLNLALTITCAVAGFPDLFFIVINCYGLLQVYMSYYFLQKRSTILKQENNTSTMKKGYREWCMTRTIRFIYMGLAVNVAFLLVLQPIGLAVLKLGACESNQQCSSLIPLTVVGMALMSLSATFQVWALPGETREEWNKRMAKQLTMTSSGGGNSQPGLEMGTNTNVDSQAP